MLKTQDIILLCKIISHKNAGKWTQSKLAFSLKKSVSTINGSIHRLIDAKLIYRDPDVRKYYPSTLCLELLKHGVPYIFYDNKNILELVSMTVEDME